MRRRDLLLAIGGAVIGRPAGAQTAARLPRVGYLSMAPGPSPRSDALQQALNDLGYVAGKTIVLDYRWADGSLDRLRDAALALVNASVAVIVTGGPAATAAARQATATIPIVMAVDYDPVGAGFVSSLGHPGGNITGLSVLNPRLSGKRLELLKEAVPAITLIAVLWDPAEPNAAASLQQARLTAPSLGIDLHALEIRTPADISKAVTAARASGAGGVSVLTDPVTLYHRAELAGLLAAQRLPAIFTERLFVEAGGLMSYGASDRELHRMAAGYVDKILKGTSPADLPVEQPTRFELVINMKATWPLHLNLPASLLERADDLLQ